MKTYSIGRDLNCDIVINDSTDVISRRHALLNVSPSGKMTIIDQSSNGTYVNGIRISPNVPVPVTRKDVVSLAHVAKLDWNQVPKSRMWISYAVGVVLMALIVLAIIFGVKGRNENANAGSDPVTTELNDSTAIKEAEAVKTDSIKKAEEAAKKASESKKAAKDKKKASEVKTSDKSGKDKSKDTPSESKEKSKDKEKEKTKDTKRPIG